MFEAGAARRQMAGDDQGASAPDWEASYGIRHIAVIPDGNRRWARERSLTVMAGHTVGLLQVLPKLVRGLCQRRVHTISAWGFSTENWGREQPEVEHLMKIFAEFLEHQVLELADEHQARVFHLGRKDRLPDKVLSRIERAERLTRGHQRHVYNVALDYGGQDELERAALRLAAAVQQQGGASGLSLVDFLDTAGQPHPNPDLVLRSSGEHRLSGFMPLQTLYSELFFADQQFPEFTLELLDSVAEGFGERRRRFGT
jgi:undecaprenyl diphosphate synthase